MFDADIFVLEPLGFILGFDQKPVEPLGDIDPLPCGRVARNTRDRGSVPPALGFEQFGRNPAFSKARDQATFLFEQSEQQMLHIDCLVLVPCCNVLGLGKRALGLLRELANVHAGTLAQNRRGIMKI